MYSVPSSPGTCASVPDFLAAGGEMGELIRATDWSATPLGAVETWSPALRMAVELMLANRFPMILWWGPELCQLYNDAYRPIPGNKHPRALGQRARECWAEVWQVIGPLIETPLNGGPATWDEDICLELCRQGFVEETHFTIAYSPVPDRSVPGGIGGVLATVHEIGAKVIGERRVAALRDLGARSGEARTAEDACAAAAETLSRHARDLPFAVLYLIDPDRKRARLAGAAGVAPGRAASPLAIDLEEEHAALRAPWPLHRVLQSEAAETVTGLGERLGGEVPPGPWSDPPQTALVVPIRSNKAHEPAGFLVAGISARLQPDAAYRDFLDLVAAQIAAAIANAREYEAEKRRAEALAEIDRAKTAFFSNVSHELRTPLTLLLGPTEGALAAPERALHGEDLEIVHRNGLRLLKLVNTLLDFSRIEAGRVEASFAPTDLAALTADLASVFRSAVERAGLALAVDCPPLPEPIHVDRDMWEKIVLNLLSNAFKFTFAGEIALALRWAGDAAELTVRDTGIGIAPEQLPRIFERFHRVPDTRSRTHEGTGIGLALVKELVRLHGGTVAVDSRLDRGTTFVVRVPRGSAHLPADRLGAPRSLASTALGAAPYVEEALRWLPDAGDETDASPAPLAESEDGRSLARRDASEEPGRLLLADDNADMRDYLRRLLSPYWSVDAVADGEAALEHALARPPDLVLSDIMMPRLDGIALLARLRADPATREIPILLLSARAGEEARICGIDAGADDYLDKPFSARELVARVRMHLRLARVRREAAVALRASEERFRVLVEAAAQAVWETDAEGTAVGDSPSWRAYTGQRVEECLGSGWVNAIHPEDRARAERQWREAVASGHSFDAEYRLRSPDGSWRWTNVRGAPIRNPDGSVLQWVGMNLDIDERKRAEEHAARLIALMDHNPSLVFLKDEAGRYVYLNAAYERQFAFGKDWYGKTDLDLWPKESAELFRTNDAEVLRSGATRRFLEDSTDLRGQRYCWLCYKFPFTDAHRATYVGGIGIDVTDHVRAEEALRESEDRLRDADRRKDEFLATLAHELRNPLAPIRNALYVLQQTGERDAATAKLHAMMQRQVDHLVRLVDDLLEVSRITRGKIELRKAHIHLRDILHDALETARPNIEAGSHEVRVSLPPGPLLLDADRVRLAQVFANLLNNAAKYMEPGGCIRIEAHRHGSAVAVGVRDSGIGIPAEMLSRVFDLFAQVDRHLGRAQGGLGIGLALVRSLVDLHGGRVEAKSEGPGRGSEFIVHLPLAETAPADRAEPAGPGAAPQTPRRLLAVDDNRDAADSLALLLQTPGTEVRVAYDGPSALETLAAFKPEAVLLDLGMPGMDGFEVARRMRAHPNGAQVALIALTGWGQDEDRRRTAQAGFDGHLVKPVDRETLRALLASLATGVER